MNACCPTCGRNFVQKRAPTPAKSPTDMTVTELYAHYKATAIAEDLAFFLRCPVLSPRLRAQAEQALTQPTKTTVALLRTRWRIERQASERVRGIPALGSLAWRTEEEEVAA